MKLMSMPFWNRQPLPRGLEALAHERRAAGDWWGIFMLYERRYRAQLLSDLVIKGELYGADYWRCLRELWTDTEFPNRDRAYWLDMFTLDKSMPEKYRNGRKCLMNYAEHARLSALLDPVRVYRGADRKYARGMSWTTDIVVATWFSDRFYGTQFNDSASVFVADVRKSRVLACFAERGEAEVVIDPRSMRFQEFEITPEERDENIKQYQRRIHEHNERLIWRNHTAQAPSGCMTLSQRKHEE
jgi:hypothetical protein